MFYKSDFSFYEAWSIEHPKNLLVVVQSKHSVVLAVNTKKYLIKVSTLKDKNDGLNRSRNTWKSTQIFS